MNLTNKLIKSSSSFCLQMTKVVTIPHSAPTSKKGFHLTDTLAKEAGVSLFNKLDSPKKIFINHSVPRNLCDLNRPPGDCGFVPFLEEYLKKTKVNPLLDIHSYPGNFDRWRNYEVVLLDSDPSPFFILNNALVASGVKSTVFRASMCNGQTNCNHIISLAKFEYDVPAVIVEFNEDLGQERLEFITDLVAMWVNNN